MVGDFCVFFYRDGALGVLVGILGVLVGVFDVFAGVFLIESSPLYNYKSPIQKFEERNAIQTTALGHLRNHFRSLLRMKHRFSKMPPMSDLCHSGIEIYSLNLMDCFNRVGSPFHHYGVVLSPVVTCIGTKRVTIV